MAVSQVVPTLVYGSTPHLPRHVDAMVLGAGTAETYTVPADAVFALITCDLPTYMRVGATAAVPTTEIADGTGSLLVTAGIQIRVEHGTTISMIRGTAASTIVTIGLYRP